MLILNVLYDFPARRCPEHPRAEVHEFTIEFSYDQARPFRLAYQADVTHDTRIVSFGDADQARTWLRKKHFAPLEGYHPASAPEGESPYPTEFALECWAFVGAPAGV